MTTLDTITRRPLFWLALLSLIVGVHVLTVNIYPPASCDETTYSSVATSVLDRGRFALGTWPAGEPFGRDQNALIFGRTYISGLLPLFAVFGRTLLVARVYPMIGWAAATTLLYGLVSRFYHRRLGAAAALLFASSQLAFLTGHTARPEIWLTAAVLLCLWGLLHIFDAPSCKPLAAFGSGLIAVWLVDIHSNGVFFAAAALLIAVSELGMRQRRIRHLGIFLAGMLVGALLWITLRIPGSEPSQIANQIPYVGRFVYHATDAPAQAAVAAPITSLGGSLLENVVSFPDWLVRTFWRAGGPLSAMVGLLALIGIWVAARTWRASMVTRVSASMGLVSLALFAVITPLRWVHYGVMWTPFWIVLGLSALERLAQQKAFPAGALNLALAAMIGASLAGNLWLVYRYQGSGYDAAADAIASSVPDGSVVLGDPVWWWALAESRTFLTDDYIIAAQRVQLPAVRGFYHLPPDASAADSVAASMRLLHPDYVIMDDALACSSTPDAGYRALREYVIAHCTLIDQIAGQWADDSGKAAFQSDQDMRVYQCRLPYLSFKRLTS